MRRDILRKKIIHTKMLNRTDVAELQMVHRYSYDKHLRVCCRYYYLINKCGKVACVGGAGAYAAHTSSTLCNTQENPQVGNRATGGQEHEREP